MFDHIIGPTTHHAPSESHPSSSLCYRRRRTRTTAWCPWFGSPGQKSPRPSLPLSNQKAHLSTQRALSFQPIATSEQKQQHYLETHHERRYHALLSHKQCYPDTNYLREAVARHRLRASYYLWLGLNYLQGVFYTIFSTKVAMFLFLIVDP